MMICATIFKQAINLKPPLTHSKKFTEKTGQLACSTNMNLGGVFYESIKKTITTTQTFTWSIIKIVNFTNIALKYKVSPKQDLKA